MTGEIVSIITKLDDIKLVDTPVTVSTWGRDGRVDRVEQRPMAKLFEAQTRIDYRLATLVTNNAFGDPFVESGRLVSAIISPRPGGGWSPWQLRIGIIPPGKRKSDGFSRDFPACPVVLMWGAHAISLTNLPPLTTGLRWHCSNFAEAWLETARRCHATGTVWLDTVTAAIENQEARRRAGR
jgi:hypothetical protein